MGVWDANKNRYVGGSGTGGVDVIARSGVTANDADIAAISASQAVQDTIIASAATKAEVAALKTLVTANKDKAVVTVVRQPDQSLKVTFDDSTTEFVAAAASNADGYHKVIRRGDSTQNFKPTLGEYPTPVSGASITAHLTDGSYEEWAFDTDWTRVLYQPKIVGSAPWVGPLAGNVTVGASNLTGDKWRGGFTAPVTRTLTVEAGLPQTATIEVSNLGPGDVQLVSSGSETFAGNANSDPATLNGPGMVIFRKSGTDWRIVEKILSATSTSSSSESTTIPADGGDVFVQGVGRFRNPTSAEIVIPPSATIASLEALGAQYIMGTV